MSDRDLLGSEEHISVVMPALPEHRQAQRRAAGGGREPDPLVLVGVLAVGGGRQDTAAARGPDITSGRVVVRGGQSGVPFLVIAAHVATDQDRADRGVRLGLPN